MAERKIKNKNKRNTKTDLKTNIKNKNKRNTKPNLKTNIKNKNKRNTKTNLKINIKNKKKFIIFISIIILLLISFFAYFVIKDRQEKQLIKEQQEKQEKLLSDIKSSYNKYVKTNKEAKLYDYIDNKYVESGSVAKDIELTLKDVEPTLETKYFLIENINLYISYKDLEVIEKLTLKDAVYKNYILFNENIVTKDLTTFYNENGFVYKINKSVDLPIIIKDTDKYYVEYNNELLYVKEDEVTIKDSKNTSEETRTNIRTLTYHTIFDTKKETCTNVSICHSIEQFDSHMKYLSENDYFTLRMKDLELFIDGKIRIPKKSIVVTLDDGKYAVNAINIVEKYKVNATYFIITGRYEVPKVKTTYMNFESHTDNLHNNWKCPSGNQGGQLLCEDENKILEDLNLSQEKLGGSTAFAYPFFDFNDRAIKLLKESGFTMAFIGQYDTDGYSSQTTDKMMLRRKTIFATDTLETFVSYLN